MTGAARARGASWVICLGVLGQKWKLAGVAAAHFWTRSGRGDGVECGVEFERVKGMGIGGEEGGLGRGSGIEGGLPVGIGEADGADAVFHENPFF